MTHTFARIASAIALGAFITGCATVPGDPYYQPPAYTVYEQPGYVHPGYGAPGYVYGGTTVYRAPPATIVYPVAPPPPVYRGGRDRWDAERDPRWREREREHRERAQERDRREDLARESDRRARDQAERERRARDAQERGQGYQRPGAVSPGADAPAPMREWRNRAPGDRFERP